MLRGEISQECQVYYKNITSFSKKKMNSSLARAARQAQRRADTVPIFSRLPKKLSPIRISKYPTIFSVSIEIIVTSKERSTKSGVSQLRKYQLIS